MAEAERLIIGDDRSRRGWRRRAVGASRAVALAEVPRIGTLLTRFPIEPLRILQRHIHDRDLNQAQWLREAAVARYLREGGDSTVAEALLDMRVDHRRRDVPRDQYGQARDREGRKR